jgi:membrane protein implicated in regulation of membrane protease activity
MLAFWWPTGRRNMADQKPGTGPLSRVVELADVLIIIIAGAILVLLSIVGTLKSTQALGSAILAVLAVVAVSILRDRMERRQPEREITEVHTDLAETRRALKAIELGRAYHVLLHDTTWDLEAKDGSLVHVERLKKLVFNQPDVVSLYDFVRGVGDVDFAYTPGKIADKDLTVEGAPAVLISLGRVYSRGDKLDFLLKRTRHGGFLKDQENVSVTTRDLTYELRMKVLWPVGRPPSAVRLVKINAQRETSTTDVLNDVGMEAGRNCYVYKETEPEKGSNTMIEWNW